MTTQNCRRGNYIIEQIEVVLAVVVQVWQVGAHFKALVKLESVVPLVLPCIFFTSQTRPPEHCVKYKVYQIWAQIQPSVRLTVCINIDTVKLT